MKQKKLQGFTLIELLIVIGIIAILAGIVLVAVNPAQQFGKANDAERKSEIGTLLSAVYQFQTSPTARGALPTCDIVGGLADQDIPECDDNYATAYPTDANGDYDGALQLGLAAGNFDCAASLIPSYLREIPIDPTSTYTAQNTGYYLCQDTNGAVSRVYLIAPGAEVFTDDGGCNNPDGSGDPVMCVSG